MINTLNESQLHKALKTFYAVQFSAQEEVKLGRWYCDLVCPDKRVVEIQTKNVGALKEKIHWLLKEGRRVMVVHPIIAQKTIETYGQDGALISRRKSPKKESLWSELREFTSLAEFLCDKKLSILMPEITMAEKRVQSEEAQQSKNKRRRFKKSWQKTDKALLTIGATYKLCGKKDWLSLLPRAALRPDAEPFSAATIRDAFIAEQKKEAAPHANLLLWLLRKASLITRVPHEGRAFFYVWSRRASL